MDTGSTNRSWGRRWLQIFCLLILGHYDEKIGGQMLLLLFRLAVQDDSAVLVSSSSQYARVQRKNPFRFAQA
jgi:hypothetical protein